MEAVTQVIGHVVLGAGMFFVVTGAIGILRMPDVFTRMHAAGVTDTMGAGLMLIGLAIGDGFTAATLRLILIVALIWFTSPIATHALAKAALHGGVRPFTSHSPDEAEEAR